MLRPLSIFLLSILTFADHVPAQSYDPSKWTNIRVRHLGGDINSPKNETVSSFSPDGKTLWFSTKRGNGLDKLSSCNYNAGTYGEVEIERNLFIAGSASMDKNGKIYFARLNPDHDLDHPNNIDIYQSTLGEEMDDAAPLPPEINTSSWESQPHISRDGQTLFYSVANLTSAPTGNTKIEANADIYRSTFVAGAWSKGVPLGPLINTKGYEGYSSLSPDGKYLFFVRRTNRKDPTIFYSPVNSLDNFTPVALPAPINTGSDMSMAFHPTENMFIIASSRNAEEGKEFDLYEIRYDVIP